MEQEQLRERLFARFRQEKRYLNRIGQDLNPLLREVQRTPYLAPDVWQAIWETYCRRYDKDSIFRASLREGRYARAYEQYYEQSGRQAPWRSAIAALELPSVEKYVQAVDETLVLYGLTYRGDPALWAFIFIHEDVVGLAAKSFNHSHSLTEQRLTIDATFHLDVQVAPQRGSVASSSIAHTSSQNDLPFKESSAIVSSDHGNGEIFTHLAAVENEIDRQVAMFKDRLRERVERIQDQQPFPGLRNSHNAASLPDREWMLDCLAMHLLHTRPIPSRDEREACRRLAKQLAVDFPKITRHSHAQKPA